MTLEATSLQAFPRRLYRDPFPPRLTTLTFWVWVPPAHAAFVLERASATLTGKGTPVGAVVYESAELVALSGPPPPFSQLNGGHWLSHQIATPREVLVDLLRYRLTMTSHGASRQLAVDLRVSDDEQRTTLIFPVAGMFTIVFGHASEGDHAERSQAFAYDIAPLGSRYELLVDGDGSENAHFAGWERDVRAPAAGTVARVQDGLADNPHPGPPPEVEAGPDGARAVLGNGLVIDHRNGEFSLLGHMRQGSLRVRQGQRVEAGEPVGKVGNSGHSSGPHLHYHLMDGPELFLSNGLPARFVGLENEIPRRGAMDEAPPA